MERALTDLPAGTNKLRLERVLCAVTFSPSARRVVEWAAAMAGSDDAEIRLFHALPNSREQAPATLEGDSGRALKRLFPLAQPLPGRTRISAAVTDGDAASEILRHARLVKSDLIAVGMQAVDGTVSPLVTRLAVDSPCPILVVDKRSTAPTLGEALEHVLIAVDFLPASQAAIDYAFARACTAGAQVTVLHVLPEHWEGPTRDDPNIHETRHFLERHSRRLLQNAVSTALSVNRDRREVVTSGRPCVEIVRLATARRADLIVMGIDARPQSADAFGETTNCVMQFAGKTVLLVPERLSRTPRLGRNEPPR